MPITIPKRTPGEDPITAIARYFAREVYATMLRTGQATPAAIKSADDEMARIQQSIAAEMRIDRGLDGDDVLIWEGVS